MMTKILSSICIEINSSYCRSVAWTLVNPPLNIVTSVFLMDAPSACFSCKERRCNEKFKITKKPSLELQKNKRLLSGRFREIDGGNICTGQRNLFYRSRRQRKVPLISLTHKNCLSVTYVLLLT